MKLVGILLEDIMEFMSKTNEGYLLNIGNQVEITTTVKGDKNKLLSSVMCSSKLSDKYILRYVPYNKVLFDIDYIEECLIENKIIPAAMFIDTKKSWINIGKYEKYSIKEGTLMLSCRLSGNYMIEQENEILTYSMNNDRTLLDKVRLLSIGQVNGDGIVGLFYIPKERGIAYKHKDLDSQLGISSVNRNIINCKDWKHYTINDWLEECKIKRKVV